MDEQNRLWGLSNAKLTVCELKECFIYTAENSGLEKYAYSMAFDQYNRLWISSKKSLRVLDIGKILPAPFLEYSVVFNFFLNYLLVISGYFLVITAIDRNRKYVPPEITVRYGLGKLWFTWIVIGAVLFFYSVGGNWNEPHSTRMFIATFLSIILFPMIRLLCLRVESKLSLKTFVLTLLLGLFLFGIVVGLPTMILVIFVNMQ